MTREQARREDHDNSGCSSNCRREGCPDDEKNESMTPNDKIKKAICCDKECGHTMSPDVCFEHQISRVEEIIKDSYQAGRKEAIGEMKEKINKTEEWEETYCERDEKLFLAIKVAILKSLEELK